MAKSAIDLPIGCSEPDSAAPMMVNRGTVGTAEENETIVVTEGFPWVMVPVLSKATALTWRKSEIGVQ